MKKAHVFIFLTFSIILFFCFAVYGQNERKVSFYYGAKFNNVVEGDSVTVIILIPQNIPHRQRVDNIDFSIQPEEIYERNGNRYGRFVIRDFQSSKQIVISLAMTLYKSDYKTLSKHKAARIFDRLTEKYLQPEEYIESDNELIIKKAKELKGKNQIQTLKNIFTYVSTDIEPVIGKATDTGALVALKTKKATGKEYTDLFIALCRASGIPARFLYGYNVDSSRGYSYSNAEVYIEGMGWVTFNPTSKKNNSSFQSVDNKYVCLSKLRNDPELRNYYYYIAKYGKKRGNLSSIFKVNNKKEE